ncbi:MAG: hypothetical protein RR313_11540 [Anaerovoracaceae bacterium]
MENKRSEKTYPMGELDLTGYLKKAWEEGWLDKYSNEHFIVRAIENRVTDIEWKEQLLFNNSTSIYSPINQRGEIDFEMFSSNFIVNLSSRLFGMSKVFVEDDIKKFIQNQLSAGKDKYDENTFFQALSEIEILGFYCSRASWCNAIYEPPIGMNGSNPEAKFEIVLHGKNNGEKIKIQVNIEVKTPEFPVIKTTSTRVIIPTVLLSDSGKKQIRELCTSNNVKLVLPRVTKLVQFINSAAKKFEKPKDNEFNFLYINWSYSDFPSNGFLEAWSVLTNEINGILTHPDIGTKLPFREPVCNEAFEKITAVIVYTSSLDQLMFSDFRHAWQASENVGSRFRMFVLNNELKNESNMSKVLFELTGMNPHNQKPEGLRVLASYNWSKQTSISSMATDCNFGVKVLDIISSSPLL